MSDEIPVPPETIWLLYEGNGQWLWCEDADPSGDFENGVDSIKYTRTEQQPLNEKVKELENELADLRELVVPSVS